MDAAIIKRELEIFIRQNKRSFASMMVRETALLEMGALVAASEHYRIAGYSGDLENDKEGVFSVKLSSRGNPYNFSWFTCTRGDTAIEIHSNLAVGGAHGDEAVYVVDVAVAKPNAVPRKRGKDPWICLSNIDLVSFVEVKKLVVYPMLLAQFVGIVHEVKPKALQGSALGFKKYGQFHPTLMSLGYLNLT